MTQFKNYRHRRWWSDEEKQRLVALVNEHRNSGTSYNDACKLVGICSTNYQRWAGQYRISYHNSDKWPPHIKVTAKETAATESLAALLSSFISSTKATIQITICKG